MVDAWMGSSLGAYPTTGVTQFLGMKSKALGCVVATLSRVMRM